MDRPFSFKVTHPHNDTYYFQAANKDEQETWLRYGCRLWNFHSHREITRTVERNDSTGRDFFRDTYVSPVTVNIVDKFRSKREGGH